MSKRNRVYVYNTQSSFGCLGLIFGLIILFFLFSFFTRLFLQIFPTLLLIGSIIVLVRSIYYIWLWHKQNNASESGQFIQDEDGVLIPIDEPDYAQLDLLKRRIMLATLGLVFALFLLYYS
ncbi:hypothetical protein EF384_02280 [Aerococcus agrisoli]|uniref:DUF3899 domain-containing protein n=1 Tax=Aerococcus agrisoli TaxID=2487350 RepID=A0A3N4GHX3_9LACT|nr:hypothetical protein [Aerococcus agrisoli]RPA62463.1 hypothetical protein EF384_02280 [Aerococcus agrisoli]